MHNITTRPRLSFLLTAVTVLTVAAGATGVAQASGPAVVPHGCAAATSDYSAGIEPLARSLALKVNTNEPCHFIYAAGDTFSGSGRFTVSCSSGGYYHHPDFQGGQYPPVSGVPIPQPCAPGDDVTLDGYHFLTGGAVIGGGFDPAPKLPKPRITEADFRGACASGSDPYATVNLEGPVNYSGVLTSTGTVRCDGADITISSLVVTPLAGFPFPSAGSTSCTACTQAVAVTGTVPAKAWIYDVKMRFAVTGPSGPTITGTRIGRYAVSWAGVVTTLCPGIRAHDDPDSPPLYVPAGDTCPI